MTEHAPPPAEPGTRTPRAPGFVARNFRELSVAGVLALLLLFLAVFAPGFFEPQPLLSRLTAAAPRLVVACGAAMILITRQIDISLGSVFAVCGVAAGMVCEGGGAFWTGVLVAVAIGAAVGALNGALVAGLRLPSIVVTLAMMVALRETLRLSRQGV